MEETTAAAPKPLPAYRSHKTVYALKIEAIEPHAHDPHGVVLHFVDKSYEPAHVTVANRPTPQAGWYYVVYENGYHSFSPADAFESGHTLVSELATEFRGIGWAVKMAQDGHRIRRSGWNGKGLFVFFVPGSQFKVSRAPLNAIYLEGTEITYRPHLDLKNADGTIGTWAPSNSDALAIDWELAD